MANERPNILLLVGEDVGRHLGCYGLKEARTPNLDRLAREGCRYENAFSTCPVCAPSRSSMVTGKYPWSLGTHQMRSTLRVRPRLFTEELMAGGYHVRWPTKTDFNFETAGGERFADSTEDWVEDLRAGRMEKGKPFFLFRNFAVTHESAMWTSARPTAEGGMDMGMMGERERLTEKYLGAVGRCDPSTVRVPAYLPDTAEVRADLARYFDSLAIADAQVGEVLAALEESGYAGNTVVIYVSDHGRGLAREKRWCYDAGVHVPLIVRWPGRVEAGTVSEELVSGVDVGATVLSIAGVEIPSGYQGRAFLGAQKSAAGRQYAFSGRDRMDETFDRVRTCRDGRYRYIRNFWPALPWAQRNHYMEHQLTTRVLREMHAEAKLSGDAAVWMGARKPAEELYDAVTDPDMVRNLAGEATYAETLGRMRAALDAHLAEVGDLGAVAERELIARGVVVDRLEEFRARIAPLPERYRIGPELTVLEMSEAAAWTAKVQGR